MHGGAILTVQLISARRHVECCCARHVGSSQARGKWRGSLPDHYREKMKSVSSEINRRLKNRGVEWALCGGKRDSLPELNPLTGFWASPAESNKAPRWIVHFHHDGHTWIASLPQDSGSHRIGAFNTANRNVSCIGILPLPAVKLGERFVFLTEWSWLLWFLFPKPLRNGSSAQVVDGYSPALGTLRYLDGEEPFIQAGLVQLCAPGEMHHGPPSLSYSEATNALSGLIQVAPRRTPINHA